MNKRNIAAQTSASPRPTLKVERNKDGKIYSHVRKMWLIETPEEKVRQEYLCTLVNEYGYALEQIGEEECVLSGVRGGGRARSDFAIWRSVQERLDGKHPFIIVECKADNVTIDLRTYQQGAHYAQYEQAKFFVTHNNRETKYWQVDLARRAPNYSEIENIPHADASDKEIEALVSQLKVFKEEDFAKLLHECHNVIRNREKLDPAAAFDEIAKILFVKVDIERKLKSGRTRKNLFTADFLLEQHQIQDDPMNVLFDQTKKDYKSARIFDDQEKITLKFNTAREVVRLLERYNLSDTSEDIKGIAFERFLGRTFRGEIGQFFTPRTIVEFMIRMVEPREGDVICDPASGSGGFLIRFFELVRQQILADVDREYQNYRVELESNKKLSEAKRAEMLRAKFEELEATLDQKKKNSRLWRLANACIYGTDANERMARTSKMNMIMHGDGHGGVHHHDGFLNVNGIFENRFNVVLTNPPFGANVEASDIILESEIAVPEEVEREYERAFGDVYAEAQARVRAAKDKPIASLFELPKGGQSKIKTEILFIERSLELLKPGGRLGIVLPEGVFNNPSLAYVREFCEDRAFIRAVVSLPQETFYSSGASVKAALLFMEKFTAKETAKFKKIRDAAGIEVDVKYALEIEAERTRLEALIETAQAAKDAEGRKRARKSLDEYTKRMNELKRVETQRLTKRVLC